MKLLGQTKTETSEMSRTHNENRMFEEFDTDKTYQLNKGRRKLTDCLFTNVYELMAGLI